MFPNWWGEPLSWHSFFGHSFRFRKSSLAFRIVRKALDELVQHCQDTAGRVRQLELYRLDRIGLSLDPKKGDPRVGDTLIRISERVAKLHGLDAPQRIEQTGLNGGPIQTQEQVPDYSKLTLEELLQLEELQRKAHGLPTRDAELGIRDDGPYSRKWYAAQRAAGMQPTSPAGS